jgi:hypothetical protein
MAGTDCLEFTSFASSDTSTISSTYGVTVSTTNTSALGGAFPVADFNDNRANIVQVIMELPRE